MSALLRPPFVLLLAVCAGLAGCDNPQRTVDRLRPEIAAYRADPTDAAQMKIESDLKVLEEQIARLEAKGKTAEATGYRSAAANLVADYRAARMVRTMQDAQTALQGLGSALKDAGKSIGDAFKTVASPSPNPN